MENLAPAGNRESLERADAAGADAVYLGYSAFSARAGAGNFDRQQLEDALRFAHLRHMRVHVTVNTLVKDAELPDVADVLRLLRSLKADAVLVQDLGVLRLLRSLCPGLAVHASTQMAIHNASGVAFCARRGIRRVVLARECSLREIQLACDRGHPQGVEIEVFGHGAQCVAVSGLCLFSSMLGERSGNRGRCAQPCRMEYRFRGRKGAWLSPRDVCLRDDLPALRAAGVDSVKLEGRLKRPEYVAVVARSYGDALRSLEAGSFQPACPEEKDALRQIFNRGGFMRGYAMGAEDAGVIFPDMVTHQGLEIGRVVQADGRLIRIAVTRDLRDGDALALRRRETSEDFLYSGREVPAGAIAVVRLREGLRARVGDQVFRLADARQMEEARALPGRRVPVELSLRAWPGAPLELTASDGENTVTVSGGTVESARTRETGAQELSRCLGKTGETVFVPSDIRVETAGAFVPVSAANSLRREALSLLAERRIAAFEPDTGAEGTVPHIARPVGSPPPMATVRTREQAQIARDRGLRVVWYPEDWRRPALEALLAEITPGDWLRLPEVCEEASLLMIREAVARFRETLGGLVLGSVGQLGLSWPLPFGAGPGIPVMNRQAAALLFEEGCAFVTASPELTGRELETLLAGDPPIVAAVYGRVQLMLLHHCPARTALGLTSGHRDCRLCDEEAPEALRGESLEDRLGYRFPLLRLRLPEGCLVRLMNSLPLDLLDQPLRCQALELTTETEAESARVLDAFLENRRTGIKSTTGHWQRKVE